MKRLLLLNALIMAGIFYNAAVDSVPNPVVTTETVPTTTTTAPPLTTTTPPTTTMEVEIKAAPTPVRVQKPQQSQPTPAEFNSAAAEAMAGDPLGARIEWHGYRRGVLGEYEPSLDTIRIFVRPGLSNHSEACILAHEIGHVHGVKFGGDWSERYADDFMMRRLPSCGAWYRPNASSAQPLPVSPPPEVNVTIGEPMP